jgi:hypothetical protein
MCMCYYRRSFGLLIEFIELVQSTTTLMIYYYTHTIVHSHVFSSRCSVAASNGGRSPASATSFSQQQLTTTEPQQFSD